MVHFSFSLLLTGHLLSKLELTQNLKWSNQHRLHYQLLNKLKLTAGLQLLAISLKQDFFVTQSDYLFEMQQVRFAAFRESG
jgi:DNA mismatch repair ATPase MutS